VNSENEKGVISASADDTRAATGWLRDVLISIMEVAPLPLWIKGTSRGFIRRLPDWLITAWARALSVDYVTAYQVYPDLAEKVRSDIGRKTVQRYLEAHNTITTANVLRLLVQKVVKQSRTNGLLIDADMIQRHVCALALAGYSPHGEEFAQSATSTLSAKDHNIHLISHYQIALDTGQKQRLEDLDAVLTDNKYARWVEERVAEIKRWLGLEPPRFHIRYSERTPLWDSLWNNILTGGGHE
jgi:hypothetical protein